MKPGLLWKYIFRMPVARQSMILPQMNNTVRILNIHLVGVGMIEIELNTYKTCVAKEIAIQNGCC